MAAAAVATPMTQWQYEVGQDWQPFTLAGTDAAEAEYQAWRSGGPATATLQSGMCEYIMDFDAMEQRNSRSGKSRAVRRQEFYSPEDVALLKGELERLRAERDALAAERDAAAAVPRDLVPRREMWRSLEALADRLFALPSHELADASNVFEAAALSPSGPREQWLRSHFLAAWGPHRRAYNSAETCPMAEIEVLGITEVYNPRLAKDYRYELSRLKATHASDCAPVPELEAAIRVRSDLGGPRLNEALLFHGCRHRAAESIIHEGFDPRLGGMNAGAAFGVGAYFTTRASKADYYTDTWARYCPTTTRLDAEVRVLLVARVALGEVSEAQSYDNALRRPPVGPNGVRCDAVLGVPRSRGGCVDHDEFIIYERKQAVPQYLVFYKHESGCRCRTCVNPRT